MNEADFWALIDQLDWAHEGDDAKVVEPLIRSLTDLPREELRSFQEILASKLYALDGRQWAKESGPGIWWGQPDRLCVDGFLYARCVVVANGKATYERVLGNPSAMPKDMEFEQLLYVARLAEERKFGSSDGIDTQVSFETFSNEAGWR